MAQTQAGQAFDTDTGLLDSGLGALFLAAFPVIVLLFRGSGSEAFAAFVQLAMFIAALRLIHSGQHLQNLYDAAANARAPRFPRKAAGCALIGVMVLLLAGHHFDSLLAPAGLGLAAAGLGLVAFGLDPRKDKGQFRDQPSEPAAAPADQRRPSPCPESSAALDRIDSRLEEMVYEVARLGDTDLTRQVEAIKRSFMRLVRVLAEDPAEMRRLRKPVTRFVSLLGRENEQLFAGWNAGDPAIARRRYLARVAALGEAFEERARKAGAKTRRDAYELEADLLWNRMSVDRAA